MSRVHGVIAVEEQPTTDGRLVQREALTWTIPVPVFNIAMGSRPVELIGELIEVERVGNYILARGEVDDPRPVMPCGIDMLDIALVQDYDSPLPIGATVIIKSGEIYSVAVYLEVDQLPAWPGVALLRIPED